jgi:hypothetical protein
MSSNNGNGHGKHRHDRRRHQKHARRQAKLQRRERQQAERQRATPGQPDALRPDARRLLAFLRARQAEGPLHVLVARDSAQARAAFRRAEDRGGQFLGLICKPRGGRPFAAVISSVTARVEPGASGANHGPTDADLARLVGLGTMSPAWQVTASAGWRRSLDVALAGGGQTA